ncbi:aromatic amino acid aminotransferase [Bifidobacterium anseris]|uniref:Aminotransferase n=1 Tax=Bifidobacterium anseris TaxID=2020963 RepID=A0A2N5J1Z4_9BIFI|nr:MULTISPECIES: aminotransferase class I/II-fold pyridoxal phosphate-dependent enzyme [Bifidobacterium]PLS28235.1 aromatic amino acid aminotransferase [Bifidobacterium anseris]
MKPINAVVEALKPSGIRKYFDLANAMKGVISLGVGEPDFDTPWHISAKAVESFEDGHTHYTANRGLIALRRRIADYYRSRYGIGYDPESQILVTVGGSEAVDLCCRTLINPGDEVIVLDPNYVAYEPAIVMAGGVPVRIELTQEHDFKLLPEDLEAAISERTKAIILNFPSNPTGGVMSRDDYARIVPIIRDSGIYVISDEIYSELVFDGEFCSPANFGEIRDQVLVINGFSKAFAMTGWRLGYLLSSPELSAQLTKVHQFVIMSAPTAAQYAAIEALEHGVPDIVAMRRQYEARRNLICARLNRMGLTTNVPKGTFYVFANITSSGLSSDEFCVRLLEEQRVAVVPGTAFGDSGEGFVRISYATGMEQIKEACSRIETFLASLRDM